MRQATRRKTAEQKYWEGIWTGVMIATALFITVMTLAAMYTV